MLQEAACPDHVLSDWHVRTSDPINSNSLESQLVLH